MYQLFVCLEKSNLHLPSIPCKPSRHSSVTCWHHHLKTRAYFTVWSHLCNSLAPWSNHYLLLQCSPFQFPAYTPQPYDGDAAGLVPDHSNKASLRIASHNLFAGRVPSLRCVKKTPHLWSALKQSPIKWGMPVVLHCFQNLPDHQNHRFLPWRFGLCTPGVRCGTIFTGIPE